MRFRYPAVMVLTLLSISALRPTSVGAAQQQNPTRTNCKVADADGQFVVFTADMPFVPDTMPLLRLTPQPTLAPLTLVRLIEDLLSTPTKPVKLLQLADAQMFRAKHIKVPSPE